jgi:HTH-type transcriptional regulator / antitoxin HigA
METMSLVAKMDEKRYVRLLAQAGPRVPETEREYKSLLTQIEKLMEQDEEDLSIEQTRLLTLLSVLVEQYEEKNYPISNAKPLDVLRHLMEARGLTHKDVWTLFGSRGTASDVINGKRSISKTTAKRLAEFFHVPADLFI